MSVVSALFLGFLVLTIILYYAIPKKARWIVLLVASTCFYAYADVRYVAYILFSITVSYVAARIIQKKLDEGSALAEGLDKKEARPIKEAAKKKAKVALVIGLVAVAGVLIVVKYTNFLLSNVSKVVTKLGGGSIGALDILVPLGISFYTFTIIAYMVDVYHAKTKAETNYLKYALYVSFFPTVTQGPIHRYEELKGQLFQGNSFDYETVKRGAKLILWGFFMKLVLADTLAVVVDQVFGHTAKYPGWVLPIIVALYSIQIYADFAGCINICTGAAETLGIKLTSNFERPFFSRTVSEFWRRWHISLGTWFKDYIFMPVSLSKGMVNLTKKARKKNATLGRVISIVVPIFAVWLLTGLWHGAAWKFVVWGLYYGVIIMISSLTVNNVTEFNAKHNINSEAMWYQTLQRIRTFILVTIGNLLFRSANLGQAFSIVKRTFLSFLGEPTTSIGIEYPEHTMLGICLLVLLAVSIYQEKVGSVRDGIKKLPMPVRFLIWFVLVMVVIVFGRYGDTQVKSFLYEAF